MAPDSSKEAMESLIQSLEALASHRGVRFGVEYDAVRLIRELGAIRDRLEGELEVAKSARLAAKVNRQGRL